MRCAVEEPHCQPESESYQDAHCFSFTGPDCQPNKRSNLEPDNIVSIGVTIIESEREPLYGITIGVTIEIAISVAIGEPKWKSHLFPDFVCGIL
jgi:hypothetical protein